MFRLFNDTDQVITVSRSHKHGDEPNASFSVEPGSPFEGLETVYTYGVGAEFADCVLTERAEPMTNRVLRYADALRQKEAALVGVAPPAE